MFSNHYPCEFDVNGQTYYSSEQFIQASKATSCNDDVTHAKITKAKTAKECTFLGSKVKGLVPQRWERDHAALATYTAMINKFGQNDKLKCKLQNTGNKHIVEACQDNFWGCGFRLSDDE